MLKAISFFFFYNPGFLCIHLEWSIQQPSIYPEAFETQFQYVVVCHSIRVSSFFLHFFFSLFSLYSLVSSLFVSYIFLINVKYLVVQGLREIIGKLLHRMLGHLNSRLDKYNSLETLKIRNIIVQYKNIDFWITNNTKKKKIDKMERA